MLYPPINELLKDTDCRYTLVVQTARRARQIVDKAPVLTNFDSNQPVTLAVHEIYEKKIKFSMNKEDGGKK
jgi:DNA-directed RNA polymerase subunit omega